MKFGFKNRCGVVSQALVTSAKVMIPVLVIMTGLSGFRAGLFSWDHLTQEMPPTLIMLLIGWFSGVVIGPLLLHWLPGEGFSFRGAMAGGLGLLVWPAAVGFLHLCPLNVMMALLLIPALASFWMMRLAALISDGNGRVGRREWRLALCIQVGAAVLALAPWMVARFF